MKRCDDEVIAIIEVKNATLTIRRPKMFPSKFVGVDSYLKAQSHFQPPILLVTESPHIKEFEVGKVSDFTSNHIITARPVNGVTGDNIMAYLVRLIDGLGILQLDGYYPVIVINALQEQCSLGDNDTGKYRTRNFIRLWRTKKSFLEQRLRKIHPSVVICSCTVGDFNLSNGSNAYYEGDRHLFEDRFETLLYNEFNLTPSINKTVYSFMGAKDLSGLVLDVINTVFASQNIPIYKTAHPSTWGSHLPILRKYNSKIKYNYENKNS